MSSSFDVESSRSAGGRSSSRGLHVSGRNKGIREIDLAFALAESGGGGGDTEDSSVSEENAVLLAAVTSLDLSRNAIEYLHNLEVLQSLRRLDVSYNAITSICGLPFTLTRLNLSHNRLRDLDGIARLPHLRELDVRANRLTNLAGLTPRIPLRVLRADDNRLVTTLGLEDMPELRVLSLANNFLERLDELAFLANAVSLRDLTLTNNPVTRVNGYRLLVGQRQAALLSLDGAPLLRPRADSDYYEHYAAISPASHSAFCSSPSMRKAAPLALASQNWAARGGSRASSVPSPHVTPVQGPPDGVSGRAGDWRKAPAPEMDSPLFDDTFMRGMWASAAAAKPPQPTPPKGVTDTPQGHRHPYATTNEGTQHGENGENGNSRESFATPVAEKHAPQPTAAVRAVDPNTVATRRSPSSSPSPATHASYARQFEEAQAAMARSKGCSTAKEEAKPAGRAKGSSLLSPSSRRFGGGIQRSTTPSWTPHAKGAVAAPSSPQSALTAGVGEGAEEEEEESRRCPTARLHDCLVAKEQLAKENQSLRGRVKKLEAQLAEARRVISEQLNELSSTRVERDALRQSEGDGKERLERAKRHAKMMESHHKAEVVALQEQFERAKTFYEAQLADLRRQLAAEVARTAARAQPESGDPARAAPTSQERRSGGKVNNGSSADNAPPVPAPARVHGPPAPAAVPQPKPTTIEPLAVALKPLPDATPSSTSSSSRGDAAAPTSASTNALAEQLKGWLYSQIADGVSKAQQEDLHHLLKHSLQKEEQQEQEKASQGTAGKSSNANDEGGSVGQDSVPARSTEAVREFLESYVLQQHALHQVEEVAREAVESEALAEPKRDHRHEGAATDAASRLPSTADPISRVSPERRGSSGGAGGHSPVEEPFVSRARPSLSPQKRW